jgi:hypothetical protein
MLAINEAFWMEMVNLRRAFIYGDQNRDKITKSWTGNKTVWVMQQSEAWGRGVSGAQLWLYAN